MNLAKCNRCWSRGFYLLRGHSWVYVFVLGERNGVLVYFDRAVFKGIGLPVFLFRAQSRGWLIYFSLTRIVYGQLLLQMLGFDLLWNLKVLLYLHSSLHQQGTQIVGGCHAVMSVLSEVVLEYLCIEPKHCAYLLNHLLLNVLDCSLALLNSSQPRVI